MIWRTVHISSGKKRGEERIGCRTAERSPDKSRGAKVLQ